MNLFTCVVVLETNIVFVLTCSTSLVYEGSVDCKSILFYSTEARYTLIKCNTQKGKRQNGCWNIRNRKLKQIIVL
jgi:hypothetical protein